MTSSAPFDPLAIFDALAGHEVDFVVIGGFAAWTLGVPIVTTDVDIVFDPTPKNVDLLVAALRDLEAVYRDPMGRRIEADAPRLLSASGGGHHLLQTRAGDLDVLRASGEFDFARLDPIAIHLDVGGFALRFAPLDAIIEMKTQADRPKDRAVLPLLHAAREDEDA